jgi:hypothetical protein
MDATLRDAAMETGEPPEPPQEGGKRSYFYGKRGKRKTARNLKSGKNIKSRRNGDVDEENPAISSARMTAPTILLLQASPREKHPDTFPRGISKRQWWRALPC